MVPPSALAAQPHTDAGHQSFPPHWGATRAPWGSHCWAKISGCCRRGVQPFGQSWALPAVGQAFAAHAGTALPGGGSPGSPTALRNQPQVREVGAKRAAPHTHTSPAPVPSKQEVTKPHRHLSLHPGLWQQGETSLCASSLPLCVPGCGASALWSHLLLKLLWAREGSYSDHGPTVPRSCLPSLGRCPFTPKLPEQAPRSALSSTPGGHSRDAA